MSYFHCKCQCLFTLVLGKNKFVVISVETLQIFQENFEFVVKHKNMYFREAQQYYETGMRFYHQKNLLKGMQIIVSYLNVL